MRRTGGGGQRRARNNARSLRCARVRWRSLRVRGQVQFGTRAVQGASFRGFGSGVTTSRWHAGTSDDYLGPFAAVLVRRGGNLEGCRAFFANKSVPTWQWHAQTSKKAVRPRFDLVCCRRPAGCSDHSVPGHPPRWTGETPPKTSPSTNQDVAENDAHLWRTSPTCQAAAVRALATQSTRAYAHAKSATRGGAPIGS